MFHNLDILWYEIMLLIDDCHHEQVSKMVTNGVFCLGKIFPLELKATSLHDLPNL